MVKMGKNKFRALNKAVNKQKLPTSSLTNKVLKKKLNADRKITFQKEVLIKEAVTKPSPLIKAVAKRVLRDNPTKKTEQQKPKSPEQKAPKQKSVERHKKRQKTQINDTKLLLNLMKKKETKV